MATDAKALSSITRDASPDPTSSERSRFAVPPDLRRQIYGFVFLTDAE